MERNADELRKLGRHRRGLIYLHYRLEEPSATVGEAMRELQGETLHFIDEQPAVWINERRVATLNQPGAVRMIQHYGTTHVIVYCRTARPNAPAVLDQPYLAAVPY